MTVNDNDSKLSDLSDLLVKCSMSSVLLPEMMTARWIYSSPFTLGERRKEIEKDTEKEGEEEDEGK